MHPVILSRRAVRCGLVSLPFLWLAACDDSGGGGTLTGAGIELPSEISAVASRDDAGTSIRVGKTRRANVFRALQEYRRNVVRSVTDLPADSDYHQAKVRKFVEIKALDIFEIIDTIFSAFRQTNYADEENVGAGWYKCKVAWEEEGEGGVTRKQLQTWYINSTLVSVGGQTINRVFGKIEEVGDEGDVELIRVQVDIEEAPTENEDGTLADLGTWEIRALFGEDDTLDDYFHAAAELLDDGTTRLTIADQFSEDLDGDPNTDDAVALGTRAVIYRSHTLGYGRAEMPDREACFGPNPGGCENGPPLVEITFSYNENYLSVAVEGEDPQSFDRSDEHEIVHKYEIFNASDGSNVKRTLSFGFPVRVEGENRFGWYGAWQDRHELWLNGESVEDGTVVVRDDLPPDQEPPSYTTRRFLGALSKVTLVEGSLDQLEGIAAEVFMFNDFRLRWNDGQSRWDQCTGDDGQGGCESVADFTSALPSLEYAGEGDARNIFIDHCEDDGNGFSCTNYVYLTSNPGPGFFEADWSDQTARWESNGTQLDTGAIADGFELWCSVGGRTYIEYTGDFDGPDTTTGWVEKTLTDFDWETYTPTFDDDADREFVFEEGREYFINNRGTNLRVTRVSSNGDEGDYRVFMEVHSVAKPSAGLSTTFPDGTVLVEPWDPESNSKYVLVTDPDDANYLLLEYAEVGQADEDDGIQVGDVVTRDLWGLRVEGDTSPIEDATLYNWEYQEQGEFWGGVTYLVDENGDFVLISDPIRFAAIQLARTDDIVSDRPQDEWLTFSLMYDGFLHGIPDTWFELAKVSFEGDKIPAVLANNVRIPDGTELTDATDPTKTYFVKAVDVGIFLGFVTQFPQGEEPDMTLAEALDLDAELPDFTAPDLDTTIPDAELKYVEGNPVD